MKVVMRRTGLSADVLRAWEKRYQAVSPQRSEGGQRLYSDDDVDRLALLQRVTVLGRNIGQVARLRSDELRTLLMEDEAALETPAVPDEERAADAVRAVAMGLVESLDGAELEKALQRGALRFGAGPLIERVIVPLLREIGDRWLRGEITPAHEHLASCIVERVLHWMRETSTESRDAHGIALATTEGERHELGIQVAAVVAADEGWRVIYLGSDLPADSILDASRRSGAEVLGLGFVSESGARNAHPSVLEIRQGLPPGVAVIAGGAGALEARGDLAAGGVSVLPGLGELRDFLQSFG